MDIHNKEHKVVKMNSPYTCIINGNIKTNKRRFINCSIFQHKHQIATSQKGESSSHTSSKDMNNKKVEIKELNTRNIMYILAMSFKSFYLSMEGTSSSRYSHLKLKQRVQSSILIQF